MNEKKSSNSLVPVVDGIDGHTTNTVGAEKPRRQGLMRGDRVKFTNAGTWLNQTANVDIGPDARFVLTDVARAVIKWVNHMPAETIVLGPGEPIPDLAAWNKQAPDAEWTEGPDGKRHGPWQFQQVGYFTDLQTMSVLSWPFNTVGGSIAIEKAVDIIKNMRRFRPGACPIVSLGSAPMKTKYGTRHRPEIIFHGWVGGPGGGEEPAPALPSPNASGSSGGAATAQGGNAKPTKAAAGKAAARMPQPKSFVLGSTVEPVSLAEELDDEIPNL